MTAPLPDDAAVADANVLMSFAVVDRLDLLLTRFGQRLSWTDAVHLEVRKGLRAEPRLQRVMDMAWPSDPIEIEDLDASRRVNGIRRALGGQLGLATLHLGEAQSMYLLEAETSRGVFLTDDVAAGAFARRLGLRTMDTPAILSECYSMGEIGCPDAYELLKQMADEDRGVRIPGNHREVC